MLDELYSPEESGDDLQLFVHALLWTIWKERNRRLFEDSYRNSSTIWDFFLFIVASWTRSSVSLSCITFKIFLRNFWSILHPRETHPI